MTQFISERTLVPAPSQTVFAFLGDFTNFGSLMPPQVKDFKADQESCTFLIEGMARLSMKIAKQSPHRHILIEAFGDNPIDYTLEYFLFEKGDQACEIEIVFNADLNPFLKMMASRPLQNFVNMLAQKLREHFQQSA